METPRTHLKKNIRPVILLRMFNASACRVRWTPNMRVIRAANSSVAELRSGHVFAEYPLIEHSSPSEMYSETASPKSVHLNKLNVPTFSLLYTKLRFYLNNALNMLSACVLDSSFSSARHIANNFRMQYCMPVDEHTCSSDVISA